MLCTNWRRTNNKILTMKTKEKVIKETWVGLIPKCGVSGNGCSKEPFAYSYFDFKDFDYIYLVDGANIRPKYLKGIEDNNGWISIKSEGDLPKTEMQDCYIMDKNSGIIVGKFVSDEKSIWLENATHYQPIEKPKPPIY